MIISDMAEVKTKVSLYFPKELFKKFETLRIEREEILGLSLSKNEFALNLIKSAIENYTEEPCAEQFPENSEQRIKDLEESISEIWNKYQETNEKLKKLADFYLWVADNPILLEKIKEDLEAGLI